MLTCTDTALDRPMILFQDIVEILHRSMSTVHRKCCNFAGTP